MNKQQTLKPCMNDMCPHNYPDKVYYNCGYAKSINNCDEVECCGKYVIEKPQSEDKLRQLVNQLIRAA